MDYTIFILSMMALFGVMFIRCSWDLMGTIMDFHVIFMVRDFEHEEEGVPLDG